MARLLAFRIGIMTLDCFMYGPLIIYRFELSFFVALPSAFQFADDSATTSGPPTLDFTVFLAPVAAVLIAFGAAIAFVAFLGAFGACCDSKCLLGTVSIGLLITQHVISNATQLSISRFSISGAHVHCVGSTDAPSHATKGLKKIALKECH